MHNGIVINTCGSIRYHGNAPLQVLRIFTTDGKVKQKKKEKLFSKLIVGCNELFIKNYLSR